MKEQTGIDLLVIGALCLVVAVVIAAPFIDWWSIGIGVVLVLGILYRVFLPMRGQAGIRWRKEDKGQWDGWIGPGKDDDPKA